MLAASPSAQEGAGITLPDAHRPQDRPRHPGVALVRTWGRGHPAGPELRGALGCCSGCWYNWALVRRGVLAAGLPGGAP